MKTHAGVWLVGGLLFAGLAAACATTTTAASSLSDICVAYQGCKAADPVLLCTQPGGHGWPTSNGDFWWQFFMGLN